MTEDRSTHEHKHVHIEVDVDLHGNFHYKAEGVADPHSLAVPVGTMVSWEAKLQGALVPFEISFAGFSPFGMNHRQIRSILGPTHPLQVKLPAHYHGNLVMKYTVTIVNGWSDDPDIEPVMSGGISTTVLQSQTILLSIDATGKLVLSRDPASFSPGIVTWKWADDANEDEFKLTFDPPQSGWPSSLTSSPFKIATYLKDPHANAKYTITTLNLGSKADGTLTIKTAQPESDAKSQRA